MFPLRGLCGHPFDSAGNKFVSHAINYIQPRPLARTRVTRANNGTLSLCVPPDVGYIYSFFLIPYLSLSVHIFSRMLHFVLGATVPINICAINFLILSL